MKTLLRDRRGSASLLFFGISITLLLLTFLILEMGAAMENYDYAMDVLQRSCNSAVERNILDAYRADRVLKMSAEGASASFYAFSSADLPDRYRLAIHAVECTESPPSMTVTGEITFSTLFAQYRFDDLTIPFQIRSSNYDLD